MNIIEALIKAVKEIPTPTVTNEEVIFIFFWSFLFSFGMAMGFLPPIVNLTRFILGKRKCASGMALSPWLPALVVAILSTTGAVAGLLIHLCCVGAAIFIAIFAVGVAGGIYLRVMGAGKFKTEFRIKKGVISRPIRNGEVLTPEYIRTSSEHFPSLSKTGFYRYGIQLWGRDELIAENFSGDEEKHDEDILKLVDELRLRYIDLIFMLEEEEKVLHTVTLSGQWSAFLCGLLDKLDASSREWWTRLVRPAMGPDTQMEMMLPDILEQVKKFEAAYAREINDLEELKANINGLKHMADLKAWKVIAMTGSAFDDLRDDRFEKDIKKIDMTFENDISTIKLKEDKS